MLHRLVNDFRPANLQAAALIGILLILPPFARAQTDCADPVTGAGTATYYEYTPGSGVCDMPFSDEGPYTAALNNVDFESYAMCGLYVRVTGPLGTIDVKIVDMIGSGPAVTIDLNRPAFEEIAGVGVGTAEVTWKTVADPTSEPISVYIRSGSNPWWTSVQAVNHRYGIAAVECLGPQGFFDVPRQNYNYFTVETGMGGISTIDDPFTLRLTDVNGQTVVIEDIPHSPGESFTSNAQFPECASVSPVPPAARRASYTLHGPVPNPFNPRTTIAFDLPRQETVRLTVYDVTGRLIDTLIADELMERGRNEVSWVGRDREGRMVPAGVYFYLLEAGSFSETKRMTLLK